MVPEMAPVCGLLVAKRVARRELFARLREGAGGGTGGPNEAADWMSGLRLAHNLPTFESPVTR